MANNRKAHAVSYETAAGHRRVTVDGMNAACRAQREAYHLLLGVLMRVLEHVEEPDSWHVVFASDGTAPTLPHSYRGYYEDLAFVAQRTSMTVTNVLTLCRNAMETPQPGWKGGEYTMDERTPVVAREHRGRLQRGHHRYPAGQRAPGVRS